MLGAQIPGICIGGRLGPPAWQQFLAVPSFVHTAKAGQSVLRFGCSSMDASLSLAVRSEWGGLCEVLLKHFGPRAF